MESGRPGEVTPTNATYAKVYSPRAYTAGTGGAGDANATVANTLLRSSSGATDAHKANASHRPSSGSSVHRAASAEVLAKRQHIANLIREAEEEDVQDALIGESLQIDMVSSNILRLVVVLTSTLFFFPPSSPHF